jgi:hypothetical protein
MGKTDRVWRGDVAKKLLAITGARTVEEAIPQLIDKKLSMFGPLKPPVDPRMAASAFGISSHFNYIPMSSSARLRPDGNGYVIDVNSANNKQRQRFSIAHEIGHKALLDHGIRITKHRGSAYYRSEEREEEDICDAIAAVILGLRAEVIHAHLNASGFSFKTIEWIAKEYQTSFEATLRAFLRYCIFPAAGVYCEMHGGLIGGVAREFIVRRAYHSAAFEPTISAEHVFSEVACLREAMRQQGRVAATQNTILLENQVGSLNAEAKRMTIYVEEQPKVGVVLLVSANI